ncbi:hypothetical protein GIB67_012152 [Kingdonia uniflora]|uniref:Uncharacterized protein n=1 Tax=Kingdonia uniflora TaxID=39325 RepID=A0A7J7N9M2_9MAGN|nr:hypothetical protein GIB67_012152 [Kingdonia uniflora]
MSPTGWVDSDYKGGKSFKYGILCGEGIIYEKYIRDIAVKVNDHNGVGSYIPEGNVIKVMCLYNGLPFVIRCTDDLKDMWAKGDEGYSMRTQFYINPTDVVREIPGAEVEEYILLDEDDNDYIISPRETKKKNTTLVNATLVKAIPVKTNVKRKGKAVIDPEEIDAYEIETPVNIVQESESECDDIDEEQERWVRYAQVGIDCLGAEDGYYSIHTSDDEDYVPTAEDLERCNEFENVDAELDDIYSKEEDDKAKIPLTVGFKELENDSTRLRLKCSEEKCKLGADNTLCNATWVAREVEALVRDVRAMTPKAIKTRMKIQYGVEISYWIAWNARQICIESIVGSYDQGYHDLFHCVWRF